MGKAVSASKEMDAILLKESSHFQCFEYRMTITMHRNAENQTHKSDFPSSVFNFSSLLLKK
ncbi:MAG: hypothetical protein WC186_07105 [Bacteroidales bacterium]